jgi:hypothetical protein
VKERAKVTPHDLIRFAKLLAHEKEHLDRVRDDLDQREKRLEGSQALLKEGLELLRQAREQALETHFSLEKERQELDEERERVARELALGRRLLRELADIRSGELRNPRAGIN